MSDCGRPLSLWGAWWNAMELLLPAFSRLGTFLWFATIVAGMTVRPDMLGVTSIVRALNLRGALVKEGLHKIEVWTARHGVAIADWPNEPFDPFFNVNTPADAAEAGRIAAQYAEA